LAKKLKKKITEKESSKKKTLHCDFEKAVKKKK